MLGLYLLAGALYWLLFYATYDPSEVYDRVETWQLAARTILAWPTYAVEDARFALEARKERRA